MARRGQLSAAERGTLPIRTVAPDAPPAPELLTPKQAVQWVAIVNQMPGGFFTPEMYPVLIELCRHIVISDEIAEALRGFDWTWLDTPKQSETFERLAQLHLQQSRAIMRLSQTLRLTPSTRYEPATVESALRRKNAQPTAKPWLEQEAKPRKPWEEGDGKPN
jgi:hypothetical protein